MCRSLVGLKGLEDKLSWGGGRGCRWNGRNQSSLTDGGTMIDYY